MVPLSLMAADCRRVRQGAGEGVVARPQPAQFRLRVALRHLVVHVVAQDRPLVVELVVDADDIVPHVDRVRHRGDVLVRGQVLAAGRIARVQVQHRVRIEQRLPESCCFGNGCSRRQAQSAASLRV